MASDKMNGLQDTLREIARLASDAARQLAGDHNHPDEPRYNRARELYCVPPPARLSGDFMIKAAQIAQQINLLNAPAVLSYAAAAIDVGPVTPMQIAVSTQKWWGPQTRTLTVSFMDSEPADLRQRILDHMNAWSQAASISFRETLRDGNVRISLGPDGYWSYLGTDILLIPDNQQTMNLEGFTMSTEEREFRRVIRHEAGHTLGFPHEHMRRELVARIDPEKAYDYFRRLAGWDRRMVDLQVLTSLDDSSIVGTPPDQDSIMCYQIPGDITTDGRSIPGGLDINQTDFAFARHIYSGSDRFSAAPVSSGESSELIPSKSGMSYATSILDVDPWRNYPNPQARH
jgi:hypothetical protein